MLVVGMLSIMLLFGSLIEDDDENGHDDDMLLEDAVVEFN